jgi:hypothetical protein
MTIAGIAAQPLVIFVGFLVADGATKIGLSMKAIVCNSLCPDEVFAFVVRPKDDTRPGDISRHSGARHRPRCFRASFRRSSAGNACLSNDVIVCDVELASENNN